MANHPFLRRLAGVLSVTLPIAAAVDVGVALCYDDASTDRLARILGQPKPTVDQTFSFYSKRL